jgi:predicted PurR-regulated permease PerM
MTTNPPESIETRLSRLESLFTNVGETVLAQSDTIDVLVANISQLTENLNNLTEQTNRNINSLAEQAAQERQQAAIDRQQAAIDRQAWQAEIQRIWEYLLQQGGNGRQGT